MATITYTGGGNVSNWSDPLNWRGGTAPGASDTALLVGGANSTVTAPVAVNNVMILSSQSVTFDGAVTTYGLGNCKGFMVCVGGTATFAPGSSLADGGVLQVGLKSIGTFVAIGTTARATTLQAERTELGKDVGGNGIMTIDGASLTDTDGLTVGEAGQGALNVIDSGHVSAAHLTVGLDAGASGHVSLSTGAILSVSGGAMVGVAGKGSGTVTIGAGAQLDANRSLDVAGGSSITLAGGTIDAGETQGWTIIAAGGSITGHGVMTTRAGAGFSVDGTVEASGGVLDLQGKVSGSGSGALLIDSGATMQIDATSVMLPKIAFAGPGATLSLAHGATVTSEVDGFVMGDFIKMAGVTGATWNATTDLLTLTAAGHTVDRLHLAGSFSQSQFAVSQQGGVGVISLQS